MKNSAAAKRAIQEMGASLFYAKVRREDIAVEEKLDDKESPTQEENLGSEENFVSEESFSGEIKFNSKEKLATAIVLADEQNLAREELLIGEIPSDRGEILDSKANLATKDNFASDKSITSEINLGSKENMVGEKPLTSKVNFGSEVLSYARKISYESPLLSFIAEVGLSGFCVALALRHLLPAEGGRIRIGALSRSLSMSSNNIRLHLEALQAKGIIASPQGNQQGRVIKFLHPFFRSQKGISFFSSDNDNGSLLHTSEA